MSASSSVIGFLLANCIPTRTTSIWSGSPTGIQELMREAIRGAFDKAFASAAAAICKISFGITGQSGTKLKLNYTSYPKSLRIYFLVPMAVVSEKPFLSHGPELVLLKVCPFCKLKIILIITYEFPVSLEFDMQSEGSALMIGNGLNMVWTNCKFAYLISDVLNVSVSMETLCGFLVLELSLARSIAT